MDSESYVDPASDWTADYSYAEPGWLEQEVITESGEPESWVRDYAYDAGGRRESVSDDVGLLRELGWSGALPETHDGVTQPVDPWDALEQDPNGATLTRDPAGALSDRLTAGGELTSWSRDPAGLPVLAMEPDGDRWTTWGLGGELPLEVQTPTEDIQNIVFEGVWLGQMREGGAIEGAVTVLSDPRGSLLNLGGEALGPHGAFGERATAPTSFDERFVYAGLERLPDGGLMLARHRAMLPEQGVFDRPDPLGLGGGLHRARYAENNPLGFVDPLGFTAQPVTGSAGTWSAGIGGLGGGVGGVQDPCRAAPTQCGGTGTTSKPWVIYASEGEASESGDSAESEVDPKRAGSRAWRRRVWLRAVFRDDLSGVTLDPNATHAGITVEDKRLDFGERVGRAFAHIFEGRGSGGDTSAAFAFDLVDPMWPDSAVGQGVFAQLTSDLAFGSLDPVLNEMERRHLHPGDFHRGRDWGHAAAALVGAGEMIAGMYTATNGFGGLALSPAGGNAAGLVAAVSATEVAVGVAGVYHGATTMQRGLGGLAHAMDEADDGVGAGNRPGRIVESNGDASKGVDAATKAADTSKGRLPRNPDDLIEQGYRETSHPDAARAGHRTFENAETGDKLRFDKGAKGRPGHAGKDHYHRENPSKTCKGDACLDREGNPTPKGSDRSHLYPNED